MPKKHNPSKLIDLLGGTTAVAKLTRSALTTVSDWRSTSIPMGKMILMAVELEKATGGKINRKSLFPDLWQQIWPELA